jgi:DHA2 family multidrug resistance protein
MFSLSHLNLNAGYWDVFWPQLLQGVAMACIFIPLMTTSMSNITREKMGNATSIYNLMRNIGGSFGIATMTTFLARRQQVHQNQLISHITPMDLRTRQALQGLQHFFYQHGAANHDAMQKSLGAIYGMLQRQSAMLSFVEAFWVMGVIFWAMLPLLLLLRNARDLHPHKPKVSRPGPACISTQPVEPEPELVGAHR